MRFCEALGKFENLFFDKSYNDELDPYRNLTFDCKHLDSEEIDEVLIDAEILKKFFREGISSDEEIPKSIFLILFKYLKKDKVKGLSFYTIVPKQRLEYNNNEVMRLQKFAEKFFANEKIFEEVHWVVESGKHKDKPNLHIHALVAFKKNGGKNFSRLIKNHWLRVFPEKEYTIDYNVKGNRGIHRVPCNTLLIQRDKISYMNNESKGSHENFEDLKIRGLFKSVDSSTSQ